VRTRLRPIPTALPYTTLFRSLLVVQLDAGRFRVPTVDDGRDAARAAQAAARTLPCVLAAECRDLVFVCHGASLSLLALCRLATRSEEHTSELQSRENIVCRLL